MKLAQSFQIDESIFPPAGLFGADPATDEVIGIAGLVSDILLILTSIAGALAVIFIIIAGFKFVTSSGDEKKIASAASTLTYAIIGLAVTILAFIILQAVQFFFGSGVEIASPNEPTEQELSDPAPEGPDLGEPEGEAPGQEVF